MAAPSHRRVCTIFALSVACNSQLSWPPVHVQVCSIDIQIFLTSVYIFIRTFSAGCTRALVYAQFIHQRKGTRGLSSASLSRAPFAGVGCDFWHEVKQRFCLYFLYFLDGGGSVCERMCVYMHTRTHTARGVLGCEPKARVWLMLLFLLRKK